MSDEPESMVKVAIRFSGNWKDRDYHSGNSLPAPNVEWPYWSVQQGMQQMITLRYGHLLPEDPFNHNRRSTTVHFFGREYMTAADKKLLRECLEHLRAFGSVLAQNVQDGRVKRATSPCKPLEKRCSEEDEEI